MKTINFRWWGMLGLIGGMLSVGEVSAATIFGQVDYSGTVTLNAPLATATAFTAFSNVEVDAGTGNYAVPTLVPDGTSVTITPFTFAPFTAPATPLWTFSVGGTVYSFNLATVAVARQTMGGNNFLSLSGTGIARITGVDDTPASFTFSAQQAVGAMGTTVTFSAENVVPEPSVSVLAGMCFLGVGWRRRR